MSWSRLFNSSWRNSDITLGTCKPVLSKFRQHAATLDWARADLAGVLYRSNDLPAFSHTVVDENFNVYVTIEIAALSVLIACDRMGRAVSDRHQDSSHGDMFDL